MKPLYVIGWIIKKGEAVGSLREGDSMFLGDNTFDRGIVGMDYKTAKNVHKIVRGTKIYKLVEVKGK